MAQFQPGSVVYTQGQGSSPLSGVFPVIQTRIPAATDSDYLLGQTWIDKTNDGAYALTSLSSSAGTVSATWTSLGSATGDLDTLTTDDATVVSASSGTIVVAGAAGELTTTGANSPGTVTIGIDNPATAPGAFTVTGLLTGLASAVIDTAGTALDLATDSDTAAVNLGTVGARTITVGNVTGATTVAVNTGTGGFAVATTGAGDIILNSDDTVLIDADGVLEINSSAGVIGIGNDADAQNINIGTGAAARVITVGNITGASQVVLNSGTAGVAINTTGAGDVVVTSADTILMDGAGVIEINSSAGVISIGNDAANQNINVGTAGTRAINVGSTTATNNIDGITLINDSINQATSINTGTSTSAVAIGNSLAGAITLDTAAGVSIGAATASDFTVGDAGADLSLTSTLGRVIVNAEEAAANAITLLSAAGGIDADAALQINITSSQAAVSDSVQITASAADGGITLTAGTGDINLTATDVLQVKSLAGTALTNQVTNSDNTNAASDASYQLATGGASSGDPYINFLVSGAGVYSMGIDNSVSDNFVISANAALGTSNVVSITSAGAMTTAAGITATTGDLISSAGAVSAATTVTATLGDITATNGNLVLVASGNKINRTSVATTTTAGDNAAGTVTLVGGTATVATTAALTASLIRISRQTVGATGAAALGELSVGTIVNATSFVINAWQQADATALQASDVSNIYWDISN